MREIDVATEILALKEALRVQGVELAEMRHQVGMLEDQNEIERLQYAPYYG